MAMTVTGQLVRLSLGLRSSRVAQGEIEVEVKGSSVLWDTKIRSCHVEHCSSRGI
jgi:hypothetical protein